jgi:hypothetical protein
MLGVDGVSDRRSWAILARNFSVENWERIGRKKKSIQGKKEKERKKERREMVSKQPSSTAEIR